MRESNAPSLAALAAVGFAHVRTESDQRGELVYLRHLSPSS